MDAKISQEELYIFVGESITAQMTRDREQAELLQQQQPPQCDSPFQVNLASFAQEEDPAVHPTVVPHGRVKVFCTNVAVTMSNSRNRWALKRLIITPNESLRAVKENNSWKSYVVRTGFDITDLIETKVRVYTQDFWRRAAEASAVVFVDILRYNPEQKEECAVCRTLLLVDVNKICAMSHRSKDGLLDYLRKFGAICTAQDMNFIEQAGFAVLQSANRHKK